MYSLRWRTPADRSTGEVRRTHNVDTVPHFFHPQNAVTKRDNFTRRCHTIRACDGQKEWIMARSIARVCVETDKLIFGHRHWRKSSDEIWAKRVPDATSQFQTSTLFTKGHRSPSPVPAFNSWPTVIAYLSTQSLQWVDHPYLWTFVWNKRHVCMYVILL